MTELMGTYKLPIQSVLCTVTGVPWMVGSMWTLAGRPDIYQFQFVC